MSMTDEHIFFIRPPGRWAALDLRELWHHRELMGLMVMREVKGRYRQMALGPLWILIQPIVNMVVLSFIFGSVAQLPSGGLPYPIFTFVGLLPWQLFATGARMASQSLLSQQAVISKVYFPRLIVPITSVATALVDFAASLVVLAGLLAWYRAPITAQAMWFVPLVALTALAALGVGVWLAAVSVRFRDVALGVTFFMPIWQYLTPVAYDASLVPAGLQTLYRALNPITPIVETCRWALVGIGRAPDWTLALAALEIALVLISGLFVFRRVEQTLVDIL